MAIQIPNAGTGNGATGDNEFVLWTKVINNFSDQTNAASKLVGTGAEQIPLSKDIPSLLGTIVTREVGTENGQIPLSEDVLSLSKNSITGTKSYSAGADVNDLTAGSRWYVGASGNTNTPPSPFGYSMIETTAFRLATGNLVQTATHHDSGGQWQRKRISNVWTSWVNLNAYTTTTAEGANVVVNAAGDLMRSTSSERYKDILAPLELDDARYADAMALKPIVYRSIADADNPAYHYYSFSAEELGAYDPAFTLWRETETVTDADGITTEQPLAERQAEGININALLAMSHAIAIKQGDLIKDLQEQINALKLKLEV